MELDAPAAVSVLGAGEVARATCEFSVETQVRRESVEFAADRGLLARLATLTHGVSVEPADAADVLAALGPGIVENHERKQIELWNSWPWLALIVLVAGAEWVVRKKQRLP
ncbi:MAG: hypothetical protein IT195_13820 [Microthrixaceae bacterium]|nr:hypothetical protein [Microthrixaceae bacterium]